MTAFYTAASAGDARYLLIGGARVRYSHCEISIRLLVGWCLQRGLAGALQKYLICRDGRASHERDYGCGCEVGSAV